MNSESKRRLDSWKEIAEYLGRDVRTVIRWEKEKELPIRRVPGGKRAGVFAYADEIDAWMIGHAGVEAEAELPAPASETTAGSPARDIPRPALALRLRFVLFVAAMVVLTTAAALWIDRSPSAAATRPPLQRPLQFARADYQASTPRGLMAGDFNGDKRLDLAFTDSVNGSVVALLGDGYGQFPQRIVSRAALAAPERLVTGDFDGDGRLDVALSSYFGGRDVEVLLGNGDGSFRRHARYDVAGRSRWIAASDLNGDEQFDLVVAASTASQVIVLFGNGDGTFRESGRYEAERDVAAIVLADLNSDGALDIVANDYRSSRGKSVSVYANKGDGTFRARESFAAGNGPLGLAVADLNSDGRADLVTANFPQAGSILFGSGTGRFAEAVNFDAGDGNGYVEIADLDRDGYLDLLVLGEHSDTASVMLGDGRGGFQRVPDIPTGNYPDGSLVADFDGDHRPDLAILNLNGNSISVYLNRTGEAQPSRRWLARLIPFRSS